MATDELLFPAAMVELSVFDDPEMGIWVTHEPLVALLARLERVFGLEASCIEYAISLFWSLSPPEEPLTAESAEALYECCLNLPLKLRAHGLDWRRPRQMDEDLVLRTRLDPQMLYYPLTEAERVRRINALWMVIVQTRFLSLAGGGDSSCGVDPRLFPAIPSALMRWAKHKRHGEVTQRSRMRRSQQRELLRPLVDLAADLELPLHLLSLVVNTLTPDQVAWLLEMEGLDTSQDLMAAAQSVLQKVSESEPTPDILRVGFLDEHRHDPPLTKLDVDLVHQPPACVEPAYAVGFNPEELEEEEHMLRALRSEETSEEASDDSGIENSPPKSEQTSMSPTDYYQERVQKRETRRLYEDESVSSLEPPMRRSRQHETDSRARLRRGSSDEEDRTRKPSKRDAPSAERDSHRREVARDLHKHDSHKRGSHRREDTRDTHWRDNDAYRRDNPLKCDSTRDSHTRDSEEHSRLFSKVSDKLSSSRGESSHTGSFKAMTIRQFLTSEKVQPPIPLNIISEMVSIFESNGFTFEELVSYEWSEYEEILKSLPLAYKLRVKNALAKIAK